MTNIIGDIGEIISVSETVLSTLNTVLSSLNPSNLESFFSTVNNDVGKGSSYLTKLLAEGFKIFDTDLGRLIVQPLLEGTMGVNYNTLQADSGGAVATLEGAVGFSLVLDGVVSALDAVLKPILGDRAPEFILDSIRKIPQSIGMEYFLGITLANTFEKAVGTPLEEAINIQVLPSRLDLNTVKMALRQHKMSDAEATAYRKKLGFQEGDWQTFLDLGNSVLPVTDIQLAYEYGFMNESEITSYLESQGYSDQDISLMIKIYLHNSETSGGQVYRSVARTAYLEDAISSTQFTNILKLANVPDNSITLELAALNLQKNIGLKQLSAGDLKVALNNGDLTISQVQQHLDAQGYSTDDIALILKEWGASGTVLKPTVNAKTIVRYYNSKVITLQQATTALELAGIRPQDAAAMLSNVNGFGTGYAHQLSDTTIISAYKDGIITVDDAKKLLTDIGTEPTAINTLLQVAQFQMLHKKTTKTGNKLLTEGEILDAFKLGLATAPWMIRELINSGYSTDDAMLLAAMEETKVAGSIPTGWSTLN